VQHERYARLRRRLALGDDDGRDGVGGDARELHLVVTRAAIVQEHVIAALEAEDAPEPVRQIRSERDVPRAQGPGRDEEAAQRLRHAVRVRLRPSGVKVGDNRTPDAVFHYAIDAQSLGLERATEAADGVFQEPACDEHAA